MSKLFVSVFVCVLCVGNASPSYIKSFVDVYRTMAPLASLPPLAIKGLTDEEKQSLEGGLKFASGLSDMGSQLLVKGANNASDVVHHGLQSALNFAERAVVEGSKLATQGLDVLDQIEAKAPHYAGTVRHVVPLVGSRSLSDVRTDVSSFHSQFLPELNQIVSSSHVIVDKVSQFFQQIVNVVNDIIQIAISLATLAITGDVGEIEKYEKDLMLRITGTTDPGGTDISEAVLVGSILSNAEESVAAKYWDSSGGGSVTGGSEVGSTKERVDAKGNNEVSSAGTVEGHNIENAADGSVSEEGLKQEIPPFVGEAANSTETLVGNKSSNLESLTNNPQDRVLISNETNSYTTQTMNEADEGKPSSSDVGNNIVMRQVPFQKGENQTDTGREGESISASAAVKPADSWSFFGMVVNAVTNTASSIKNAIVGGPKTNIQAIPEEEKNATATGSTILSGERSLDGNSQESNSSSTTNNNSTIDPSNPLEQTTFRPGNVDQVNTSMTPQESTTKPDDEIQIKNSSTGTDGHEDAGKIEPEMPDSLERNAPEAESPDLTPGARSFEGMSDVKHSELNTSTSTDIDISFVEPVSKLRSDSSVTESVMVQDNSTGSSGTVTDVEPSTLNKTEVRQYQTQTDENGNNVVQEHNGVHSLNRSNSEPKHDLSSEVVKTNNSESSSGYFGQLVNFVGKVANNAAKAVVDTVAPENAKFVENVAPNESNTVIKSVTPDGSKVLENRTYNVTKLNSAPDGEELRSTSRSTKGSANGAYDLDIDHKAADVILNTTATTGNVDLLNLPEAVNQIAIAEENPQQIKIGVEKQLEKPDNVDDVTRGVANDALTGFIAGARGLADGETFDTNHLDAANSANGVLSVSHAVFQNTDQLVKSPEIAEKVESNKQDSRAGVVIEENLLVRGVTASKDSDTITSSSAATSAPHHSPDSAVRENEVSNSPEGMISGARGPGIEGTPAYYSNAATISTSSLPRGLENEVLNSLDTVVPEEHGIEDAHRLAAVAAAGISSLSTSFTFPEPNALQGTMQPKVLDSPEGPISGARGIADGGIAGTNVISSQAPATSKGIDLFGDIAHIVGKAASNAATAVVETVAPEGVKFVEHLASNVTKAVIERVTPEGKRFVENLAHAVMKGVSAGENVTDEPASIPLDGIKHGARGLEKYIPGVDSEIIPIVTSYTGGASLMNAAPSASFSTSKTPQIQPNSRDLIPTTEDSTSQPPDGGWIFVNVVDSKPELFYAPEGNGTTINKEANEGA